MLIKVARRRQEVEHKVSPTVILLISSLVHTIKMPITPYTFHLLTAWNILQLFMKLSFHIYIDS